MVDRVVRWFGVCVVSLFWSFGCSSGGNGAPGGGFGGQSGKPSTGLVTAGAGGGSSCAAGLPCDCGDGLTSKTECAPGATESSCACDACVKLEPVEIAPFETCVGNVFGDWELDSAKFEVEPLQLYNQFQEQVGTCPMQLVNPPEDYRLNLRVPVSGAAALAMPAPGFNTRLLSSCIAAQTGKGCGDLRLANGNGCIETECGVCECNAGWPAVNDERLYLQLDTKTFTLTNGGTSLDSIIAQFQYCAEADKLTLYASGIRLKLRKVAFGGAPTPCDARSAADCELGPASKCHLVAGACSGTAPAACAVGDFGLVPGCVVYESDAACVDQGTPKTCADYAGAGCVAAAGCGLANACSGPTIDCAQIFQDTGVCDVDVGCIKGASVCSGITSCSKQDSQGKCKATDQCIWSTACVGTLTPCSEFPLTTCEAHAGCAIEGKLAK